jgi:N-acetylglucosaminyl-diphospho-decaprenol L-rhamnosyltransferase
VVSSSEVSAIVVHFRTPAETVRAAAAVAREAPGAELIVVDNASRDDVEQRLAREVPSARVIAEPRNRGYGAACNRGAKEARGRWLIFLNSDAYVRPGCVEALVHALASDPRAGLAGPRLLDGSGEPQPSVQRLPAPWRIFCESSGLAAVAGGRGILSGHTRTRQDHSRSRPVEALMGAVLMARREAFEEVQGFDEAFFLYGEESDLERRLADRGWRILFVPDAVAVHSGGASGGDPLFGILHESLGRYVAKHHGPAAAAFARAVLYAGAAGRYGLALVTPGERGKRRRRRYRAALRGGTGGSGAGTRDSGPGTRSDM